MTRARCLALASSLAWASLTGCADTSPECGDLLAQAHGRAETGNLDAQFKLGTDVRTRGPLCRRGYASGCEMVEPSGGQWACRCAKGLGFHVCGRRRPGARHQAGCLLVSQGRRTRPPRGPGRFRHRISARDWVPQDLDEATRPLRLSAEQGYARGQFNLGHSYETGQGESQDYVQAYMWYKLAAGRYPKAERALKRLAETMTPQAVEKGNSLSQRLAQSSGDRRHPAALAIAAPTESMLAKLAEQLPTTDETFPFEPNRDGCGPLFFADVSESSSLPAVPRQKIQKFAARSRPIRAKVRVRSFPVGDSLSLAMRSCAVCRFISSALMR